MEDLLKYQISSIVKYHRNQKHVQIRVSLIRQGTYRSLASVCVNHLEDEDYLTTTIKQATLQAKEHTIFPLDKPTTAHVVLMSREQPSRTLYGILHDQRTKRS